MAKVVLEIKKEDGTVLKFKKTKIKARWIKEAFKLDKKISEYGDSGNLEGLMDIYIEFVVDFFNDPNLTEDVLLDNFNANELIPACRQVIVDIFGGMTGEGEPQRQETPSKDITASAEASSSSAGA